jgi:hypothetical protein
MSKKIRLIVAIVLSTVILLAQQPVSQGPQASNVAAWLVTGVGGTFPVTGTFWQTTQPVSGTVTANAGTGPFPISGTPQSTSTYAPSVFDLAATAATQVKASGGNVYGFIGFNPNATTCNLQFYNSTAATLGTSPLHPFGVVAGGSFVAQPGTMADFNFSTGISTGETTTGTGATPCSIAMSVTILYN